MIVNPTVTTDNYKKLKMEVPFWACGYLEGTTEILKITPQDNPVQPPNSINGPINLDGFACDDWDDFNTEIDNRGLARPPEEND